jgi:hypothetical protein
MIKKIFIFILVVLIGIFVYFRFTPSSTAPTISKPPVQPIVAPPVENNPEANIKVSEPVPNATLSSPFKVTGEARVFENQFAYRLKDFGGNILAQGSVMANAPDMGQFGPFDFEVSFSSSVDKGVLEVLDSSPKDGAEIDMVTIPLNFKASEAENSTVKVFFMNNKYDPEVTCEKVFSVERVVPKTPAIAKSAIEELLKGPTENDRYLQYTTQLNDGVTLNKLTIIDGMAKADFDKKLEEGVAGSCRVGLIRKQIEETLKQFPSIKSVIISVDGRTEDILQP